MILDSRCNLDGKSIQRYSNRGQALIEFALVLPLFIFMVLVFIDVGRAIFTYASLSNAVREGTRYAIVHDWTNQAQAITDTQARVRDFSSGLDPAQVTPTVTPPASGNQFYITIVATYPFQPITPGLMLILGSSNTFTLQARSSALTALRYQP
jgi:Flp pilus assembly protein TadG